MVDISKYMNCVLAINPGKCWIRVQMGVILDELNLYCKSYGLFFGPEISTSNRCCLSGIVENNSCGSYSLVYGSTRDRLLEIKVILSDGSEVILKGMTPQEMDEECKVDSLEGRIYNLIITLLSNTKNRKEIVESYLDVSLQMRNSGYMPLMNYYVVIIYSLAKAIRVQVGCNYAESFEVIRLFL